MKPQDKTARDRFGDRSFGNAVPSEYGQKIMDTFSPAVQLDKKMLHADLQAYVGNSESILNLIPSLEKVSQYLPKGLVLLIRHIADAGISKNELVEFVNSNCSEAIGKKISINDINEIGKRKLSNNGSKENYIFYTIVLTNGKSGESTSINSNEVKEKLNSIDKFKGNDLDVLVGKKQIAEQFFKRNPGRFGELNGKNVYIFISILGGKVLETDVMGAMNNINSEMNNSLTDDVSFTSGDIKLIGQRMKKNPVSEKFEKYDMFAVRTSFDK